MLGFMDTTSKAGFWAERICDGRKHRSHREHQSQCRTPPNVSPWIINFNDFPRSINYLINSRAAMTESGGLTIKQLSVGLRVARKKSPHLIEAELTLMQVLWD